MGRLFFWLLIILLIILGIRYLVPTSLNTAQIDLYGLVPKDAVYIIETDKPIEQWEHFKGGAIWNFLKKNDYLASINQQVEALNETLSGKEGTLKYILHGKMLTSAHITAPNTYDFLYLLNLDKVGPLTDIPILMRSLFKGAGYQVSPEKYGQQIIYNLYDKTSNSNLYIAFKDNALIASYRASLVHKALDTAAQPYYSTDSLFVSLKNRVHPEGLSNVYINHLQMFDLANCYGSTQNTPLTAIEDMLSMSAMNLNVEDQYIQLQGQSAVNTKTSSYLKALLTIDKAPLNAPAVLPDNTSFFSSITFDDFPTLQKALRDLKVMPPPTEPDGNTIGEALLNKLQAEIENEIPNWIDREITLALVPKPNSSGNDQAYVAVLPLGDKRDAIAEKLSKIIYTIDQLNPFSIFKNEKKHEYMDYRIIRLPVEGLLRRTAGDFFKDMGKANLCLIDNFLVFCDDESVIKSIIEAFENGQTLAGNSNFQNFFARFNRQSNIFTYLQTQTFYPVLLDKLNESKKQQLIKNKDYFLQFPQVAFQMLPDDDNLYRTSFYAEFNAQTQ